MELVREIIAYALSKEPHKIGYNAAWTMPRGNNLASWVCHDSNPPSPVGDALPFPLGLEGEDGKVPGKSEPKSGGFYATATALRL
jgi:hypothetical protein